MLNGALPIKVKNKCNGWKNKPCRVKKMNFPKVAIEQKLRVMSFVGKGATIACCQSGIKEKRKQMRLRTPMKAGGERGLPPGKDAQSGAAIRRSPKTYKSVKRGKQTASPRKMR
mmetsp:Transcript_40214/g.85788  ORF Transcript_40214/g.85788 Transcript_40214/m.85788 type:complete len:114 (-) Transcript_40214:30-371(-)